jgi:hypothetical protein
MTSSAIRAWFTTHRLNRLNLVKMEDLAGIDNFRLHNFIHSGADLTEEECRALTPLLKMIKNGFEDCNITTPEK